MADLTFSWDPGKESANLKKHRVPFSEAETAFYDKHARIISDPDHSDEEERFLLLGVSLLKNLLIVCHCYLEEDSIIRIISARKATKHEKRQYEVLL